MIIESPVTSYLNQLKNDFNKYRLKFILPFVYLLSFLTGFIAVWPTTTNIPHLALVAPVILLVAFQWPLFLNFTVFPSTASTESITEYWQQTKKRFTKVFSILTIQLLNAALSGLGFVLGLKLTILLFY